MRSKLQTLPQQSLGNKFKRYSDSDWQLQGLEQLKMAEFAEIAVRWPYARPAITFPGGQDTMTHKIHNPTVFQTSVRDLQEAAHVTTIPNFNLTQIWGYAS